MRRKDREITELTAIEEILQDAFVCHLAMVDDGTPYVVPLNFAYQDGTIYLHSAAEGRKLDILRKNNLVCFEMEVASTNIAKNGDEPCEWGTVYRSVIGYGKAEILEKTEDKINGLKIIVKRFDGRDHEFPAGEVANTTVIRVPIDSMTAKAANQ